MKNPSGNMKLNSKTLNHFPIEPRARQGCLSSPALLNIVWEHHNTNEKNSILLRCPLSLSWFTNSYNLYKKFPKPCLSKSS